MVLKVAQSSAVVSSGDSVSVSQLFTIFGSGPAYLVVNALDRNEYTAASSDGTGSFAANGHMLGLATVDGDGRGAGIVYTWQASTGQYVNATYGALSQLSFVASASPQDVTSLSLFGASSLAQANTYANDAFALIQTDSSGYLGSATIVTNPANAAVLPTPGAFAATPDSIASTALSFVGDAWNMDGCWVLASTIAAESRRCPSGAEHAGRCAWPVQRRMGGTLQRARLGQQQLAEPGQHGRRGVLRPRQWRTHHHLRQRRRQHGPAGR